MPIRPIQMLLKTRPRRAVFTTFTFNFSLFESHYLPVLRAVGCEEIVVLVDARQLSRAMTYVPSRHAGVAYRIIPVPMTGPAVFHPKIVYLVTDDNDLLVVETANLTPAGQNKQREMIDAVFARDHPGVFSEIGRWFTLLRNRIAFPAESDRVLESFGARAAEMGERHANGAPPTAWLIHNMERSASAQLADLVENQLEAPKKLTVLSPFHAPDAGPVVQLAKECGVNRLRIGLSADTYVVPFDKEKAKLPDNTKYVVPDPKDKNANRPAHAKYFEIASGEAFIVMSGSFNATKQSLNGTEGVEISLARLEGKSPFSWKVVQPAGFEPCDFSTMGALTTMPYLVAEWRPDGKISGTLRPTSEVAMAELQVWNEDIRLHRITNLALDGGTFETGHLPLPDDASALRLKLIAGELEVEGCINVETQLTASPEERELSRTISRIMAGQHEQRELNEIIAKIALMVKRQEPPRKLAKAKSAAQAPKAPPTGAPNRAGSRSGYDDWREDDGPSIGGLKRQLAKRLIGAAIKGQALRKADGDEISPGQPGPGQSRRRHRLLAQPAEKRRAPRRKPARDTAEQDKLREILDILPAVLTDRPDDPFLAGVVALSASEALKRALPVMSPHLAEAQAIIDKPTILGSWLSLYASFAYSPDNRGRLTGTFCALACCAVCLHEPIPLAALKEAVLRLVGHPLDASEWMILAREAMNSDVFARIAPSDRDYVAAIGTRIANAHTLQQQMERLVGCCLGTLDHADDLPPEYEQSYEDVIKALREDKLVGLVESLPQDGRRFTRCPCCSVSLDADEQRQLRTRGAAIHLRSCKKALFLGLDMNRLADYGVPASRYKH